MSVEPHLTLVWPLAQEHRGQAGPLDDLQAPVPQVPFDWKHAQLEPLRYMLLDAVREGRFHPQPELPL